METLFNFVLSCFNFVLHYRADHNVQDLRAKLFPLKIKKAVAPEAVPLVPLLGKRKERSLSSLGVSTPSVSAQSGLTGRRMKSAARKRHSLQESTHSVDRPVNEVEDDKTMEDSPNSSNTESKQHTSNKDKEDHAKPCEGKTDMWKPLNDLVEAASKTRPIKLTRHGPMDKPVLSYGHDNEPHVPKTKIKEHGNKLKGHGDENGSTPTPSGSRKPRKVQGVRQRRAVSKGLKLPAQAMVKANSKRDRRFSPIWFSLVTSNDQGQDAPLPQISSCYLRVK
nr:E3 ubiquitin protein ligase DRIP2-like [Quercus suber]